MPPTTLQHQTASCFAPLLNHYCRLARRSRLLAGAFLLLWLAAAGGAAAQGTVTNCLTVICPPPIVTNYICGDVFVPQNYPIIISNSCPNLPFQVNCNPPPGTPLGVGVHLVQCVVTAGAAGGTVVARCDFRIVVIRDTVPPEIKCPEDLTVSGCLSPAGLCGAVVNYPAPTASDNSGMVALNCVPPSGSFFPCGITTVTCTAVDRCQNAASCTFRVRVTDDGQPPTIQCPPDLTVTTCSNSAVVIYPVPAVTPTTAAVTCVPSSGSVFPLGTSVVTCTAVTTCGSVSCTFKVTVRPVPPATITCPTTATGGPFTFTVPCGSNCVPILYPAPVVTGGTLIGCTPPSGTCLGVGNYVVTCRARNDCGDVVSCEFNVVVNQGQGNPPSITCPTNITVNTCSNTCQVVGYPSPTVVNGVLTGCTPPSGYCFPIGTSTVTCRATNACGSSVCTFTVTVRPVPPAVITCPSNIVVTTAACSTNCVPVTYPAPTVSGGTLVGCFPPSGSCFPVGLNFVTCRATNVCGEVSGCEFQVRVVVGQGNPPTILCPTNLVVTTCATACQVVAYPAPTVVNGVLTGCTPPSGFCFPIGTTTVTCRATNACGSSECKFDVIVRPVPPAVITCPSNIVVTTAACSTNCVPVAYPAPTVSGGTLVGCFPPSGSCFPVGLSTVTCRATNACGSVVGCEFQIRVVSIQGEPPIIRCPEDLLVRACTTNCRVVAYSAPTVLNGTLIGCSPASGSCFPLGLTTVTCKATNTCGTAECSFNVIVRLVPEVDIICPSNVVVTTCTTAGEIVNYPAPTLTGDVDSALNSVTCTPPSGSLFPIGTTTVRCCVVDACQRTNCCTFTVTVLPGAPCVKPPLNMVLWLPLDEPAGVIANNIVPGAPNGLHLNGPVPLIGQYVLNSRSFDGVNDFARVPNYAGIMLSTSDLSIDAWILRRDNNGGRRVIVSKIGGVAAGANARGYEYYLNNGVMNLALLGPIAQNFNSGVVVPLDNAWHHVTVTVRRGLNGSVRFYLDGALVNVQAGAITAPIGNNSALYVGAGTFPAPNSFFRGSIDEVEIFNRALTPAEILGLYNAKTAGKCKIKCSIPWDVSFRPGSNYVTVLARIWNCTAVPQTVTWNANGPMPIPTPNGTLILPPFTCTNVPVQLCRPTNGQPVGSIVRWTLAVSAGGNCPIVCTGSVINPGPVIVTVPVDPVLIPGTNLPRIVRIGLNGLPPGQPVRLRVMGPDMDLDRTVVSLNGLPPGEPLILGGGIGAAFFDVFYNVSVRFTEIQPIGAYPILVEADVDGDGQFDTLASFDVENTIVPPPTIFILSGPNGHYLDWKNEGDGLGVLETSRSVVDGEWIEIPGAGPGYPVNPALRQQYFRIAVPTE